MKIGPRTACVLLIVVSAGCLGTTGGGTDLNGGQLTSPPEQPQELNNSSVKSYALEYERQFLEQHLEDRYEEGKYGVGCCTTTRDAVVVAEDRGTYYAQVRYPYYYSTSSGETDAASMAIYGVSQETTTRIELGNHTVTAEDPYSGSNQSTNAAPPTIWVVNTGSENQEFSLSMRHEGQDELAYDYRRALSGNESVEFSQVVSRTGAYQLTVSVGAEQSTTTYTNEDADYTDLSGAPDHVVVLVTDQELTIHEVPRNL